MAAKAPEFYHPKKTRLVSTVCRFIHSAVWWFAVDRWFAEHLPQQQNGVISTGGQPAAK